MHSALDLQEMAAITEMLRHATLQLRNHSQVRIRSSSRSRVHERERTEVRSALDLQYQEMAAITEMLRHATLQLRNHSQVRIRSGSWSRVHERKRTEARIKGRKLFVESVQRAKRIKATAQKVAVAKGGQLTIRTQRLQKFESSAKSSRHPGQRASKMHAARHTDKIKYPNISSNSDSNARKLRSQETIRSGALTHNNQRKPNR